MVFRRSEETEWSRFPRPNVNREREQEEAEPAEVEQAPDAAPPPVVGGTTYRPSSAVATAEAPARAARTAPAPAPSPAAVPEEEVESIIGERSFFDGTFRAEQSLRVRGTAQGEIECKRAVYIEERASVNAKVTASSVVIAGKLDGQIFCSGKVEIRPSGRVTGEIHAATLVMQEGAFFEGHLKMSGAAASSEDSH